MVLILKNSTRCFPLQSWVESTQGGRRRRVIGLVLRASDSASGHQFFLRVEPARSRRLWSCLQGVDAKWARSSCEEAITEFKTGTERIH
ncbi:hypothetical protein CsSME_00053991 [Camellia sinensis var. sinensis]